MNSLARDLIGFFLVIVFLFFLWVFTGGPERYVSQKGPLLAPPAPLGSGDAYGVDPTLDKLPAQPGAIGTQTTTPSPYRIDTITGQILPNISYIPAPQPPEAYIASSAKPLRAQIFRGISTGGTGEYLVVVNPQELSTPLLLTGTTLKSGSISMTLPGASALPLAGTITPETSVTLPPGGYALVMTGSSPIGISFQVNKCSGYLGQFQTFTPELQKTCPSAADEAPAHLRASCPVYFSSIPRCQMPYYGSSFADQDASAECRSFASSNLSYNSCVQKHQSESGFKTTEYRLYLKQNAALWNGKTVELYSTNGELLGRLSQ